jgi:hypothetical protein
MILHLHWQQHDKETNQNHKVHFILGTCGRMQRYGKLARGAMVHAIAIHVSMHAHAGGRSRFNAARPDHSNGTCTNTFSSSLFVCLFVCLFVR